MASPYGITDALHIANSSGTNLTGSVAVPNTGGYETWTTVTASVTLPAGAQTLTVDQDSNGWNFHYLAFTQGSGGGGGGTGGTGPTEYCGTQDLALDQPTTASSTQDATDYPAADATDGDPGTRWSSAASDPQWLEVDLGSPQQICSVGIAVGGRVRLGVPDPGVQRQLDLDHGLLHDDRHRRERDVPRLRDRPLHPHVRHGPRHPVRLLDLRVRRLRPDHHRRRSPAATATAATAPAPGSAPPRRSPSGSSRCSTPWTSRKRSRLLSGDGSSSYIGQVNAIPNLCIKSLNMEDGPSGVGDGNGGVTAFPDGENAAATWDPALIQQEGAAKGAEFAGKGVNVSLGPTTNLVRDPRWGRTYETYGEDPYLAGQITSAEVDGLQSQGVMAEVKHVAAYDQEQYPNGGNNETVSQQALEELYLAPFQTAIEQSAPASFMCSYAVVNGAPSCANADMLQDGLDEQANYGGFVISDWGAAGNAVVRPRGRHGHRDAVLQRERRVRRPRGRHAEPGDRSTRPWPGS